MFQITFAAVLKEDFFLNNSKLPCGRDADDGLSARYALYLGELSPEICFFNFESYSNSVQV